MFNLPSLPKIFNTRHLSCVVCKEKFVISEGTAEKRQELPSVLPNVSVRYEDKREQLPVVPSLHASQQPASIEMPPNREAMPQEINCPRCGADNRNWLYLNNRPPKWALTPLEFRTLDNWLDRMPGIRPMAILAVTLITLIAILDQQGILPRTYTIVLAFAIPCAIGGTFWDLTNNWKKFREEKYLRKYNIPTKNPESRLLFRSLFLIVFFSVILPYLCITLLPRTFQSMLEFVYDLPEEKVGEVINEIEAANSRRLGDSEERLQQVSQEMLNLLTQMPAYTSPRLEEELEGFSNELNTVTTDAINAIDQTITESTDSIEAQRVDEMDSIAVATHEALTEFNENFLVQLRFQLIWAGLLGISTLVTAVVAFSNLQKFIKGVNAHLPLPIFHSVAGMTRLVTWESKQALEIQGNMQHIQWMSVNRNEEGGIDLAGLFRDPPEFDIYGEVKGTLVRAQKHTIQTDKWCRIVNAKIEDVMVPIPAGAPAVAQLLPAPSHHDAPPNVRITLQER